MEEHPTTKLAREIVSDFDAHRPARLTALAPYRNVDLARRLLALEAVVEAAEEFAARGTVLTACDRGPCQRVVEAKDNSDPQAKLYDALAALDKLKEER